VYPDPSKVTALGLVVKSQIVTPCNVPFCPVGHMGMITQLSPYVK
jgi:hypothetical protein